MIPESQIDKAEKKYLEEIERSVSKKDAYSKLGDISLQQNDREAFL